MRTLSRWAGIAAAVSLACCLTVSPITVAKAGPLPLNPDALSGWTGTSTIASGLIAGHTLDTKVEYAVFAPGQFNAYFGAGADPSNGTEFVYAYEVTNTGSTVNVSRNLSGFTVALLPTASASNVGFLPLANWNYGLVPNNSSFGGTPPSSARWNFTSPTLALGGVTQILLYTSPKGPTLASASALGGGIQGTTTVPNFVPTPIPEPSTFALLAIAGITMLAIRRRVR